MAADHLCFGFFALPSKIVKTTSLWSIGLVILVYFGNEGKILFKIFKTFRKRKNHEWDSLLRTFIGTLQVGFGIGWVSPNIDRFTASDSPIPIDKNEASWLASVSMLSGLLGSFVGLACIENFGSRATVILSLCISCLDWLCVIMANSYYWLLASRILSGIAIVVGLVSVSPYLGEVANPKIRGTLISIAISGSPSGRLLGTIAETYLPSKVSASFYLSLALLTLLMLAWLRNTPYYLVKRNDVDAARESIAFYYPECDEKKKLQEVVDYIESHTKFDSFREKLRDLVSPSNRKAFMIIVGAYVLPHLSGSVLILAYMGMIMKEARSNLIGPEQYVICANAVSLVSLLTASRLVDKLGRRFHLILASLGTTLAMAALGAHFFLLRQGLVDPANLQWLPAASIVGYLVAYSMGYSTVPSTLLSELIKDDMRSSAALLATLPATFASFAVTKAYQPLVDSIGHCYVFWIHAGFSFIMTPFVLLTLPETKGKTFQEIQNILLMKKY